MSIDRKQLLFGMASFIPGFKGRRPLSTGGTNSAQYCYSVWLRHLTLAFRSGLCSSAPEVVAELGPGDSIGIGLAALLSGCRQYIGLDVVDHADLKKNLGVFDELVTLFKRRAPIPSGDGFINVKPQLESYVFPSHVLSDEYLDSVLSQERIEKIRFSISNVNAKDSCVRYIAPWYLSDICPNASIDMIYSQAVMEYVADYANAYRLMHGWLKPRGFISHQIDFKSHGTTDTWDGHWACSDLIWALIKGRRPYFITRAVHCDHVGALKDAGFEIVVDQKSVLPPTVHRQQLHPRLRGLDPEELKVAGAFILARRAR